MMLTIKIAFRNTFRQKRRSFFTFLSLSVGFFLLSLSLSIADGSYNHLITLFTKSRTGHIQVHNQDFLERPSLYKNFHPIDFSVVL